MADAEMQLARLRASGARPEAIEEAKAKIDGSLEGYLCWLAQKEPSSFSSLLGRVLPIQIKASAPDPTNTSGTTDLGRAIAFALRLGMPQTTPGDGAKVIGGNVLTPEEGSK